MTDLDLQEFGHLQGTVEAMQRTIAQLQADMDELKKDVHTIMAIVSELRSRPGLTHSDPSDNAFALFVCAFAGAGLYLKVLTEWPAVILVFAAGIIKQHGNLNKLAQTIAGIFRRNGVGDRRSTARDEIPETTGETQSP